MANRYALVRFSIPEHMVRRYMNKLALAATEITKAVKRLEAEGRPFSKADMELIELDVKTHMSIYLQLETAVRQWREEDKQNEPEIEMSTDVPDSVVKQVNDIIQRMMKNDT